MNKLTKLTKKELAFIRKAHKSCEQLSAAHVDRERLLDHTDALTAELAQARAEVAALRGQLQIAADAASHWLRDTAPAVQEVLSETAARAGVPDGWKLVPVKPTTDMEIAATEEWLCKTTMEDRSAAIWKAMLAAAPQPPARAVAVEVEPLVWEMEVDRDINYPAWTTAMGEAGPPVHYRVFKAWCGKRDRWEFCGPGGFYETADAAFAAAQADYAHRILSAINARPVDEVKAEALRWAVHKIEGIAADCERKIDQDCYFDLANEISAEADRLDPPGGAR